MKNYIIDILFFSTPLMLIVGANLVRIFVFGGGYII